MTSLVGSLPALDAKFLARAAAFSSSGRQLVAGTRLYRSPTDFEDLWTGEALEWVLPHPKKPWMLAVLCVEPGEVPRFELVDLDTKARVPLDAEGLPLFGAWAFSPSGDLLAGASSDGKVHLFDLNGKRTGVLSVPEAPDSMPGICFVNGDVVVFPDHERARVLPLDGSTPRTFRLPPVKVNPHLLSSAYRAQTISGGILLEGFDVWRSITEDGTSRWSGKGRFEAAAVVPGGRAVAIMKMTKKVVAFQDAVTGEEIATSKVKAPYAPMGFSCSSEAFAYAVPGSIEVVALPPAVRARSGP